MSTQTKPKRIAMFGNEGEGVLHFLFINQNCFSHNNKIFRKSLKIPKETKQTNRF